MISTFSFSFAIVFVLVFAFVFGFVFVFVFVFGFGFETYLALGVLRSATERIIPLKVKHIVLKPDRPFGFKDNKLLISIIAFDTLLSSRIFFFKLFDTFVEIVILLEFLSFFSFLSPLSNFSCDFEEFFSFDKFFSFEIVGPSSLYLERQFSCLNIIEISKFK